MIKNIIDPLPLLLDVNRRLNLNLTDREFEYLFNECVEFHSKNHSIERKDMHKWLWDKFSNKEFIVNIK